MTPQQIIFDLKARGERDIQFNEDGTIFSRHGNTLNYWVVVDGKLVCYHCNTIGY